MSKKFVLALWLSCLCICTHANNIEIDIVTVEIETALGVNIVYDSVVKGTWEKVTYNLPVDSAFLLQYLKWLRREYLKYPIGYFKMVNVKTIALCTDLHYDGQNRAAIPDAYRSILYLAVDGAYEDSSETYVVHVMHHELNHCTEYALWTDMRYVWKEWKKKNACCFRYGGEGADAYENLEIDWYSMNHPRRGFINLYSTTAQEEDRSELVALMLSDLERKHLLFYCRTDKRLKRKVFLAIDMLNIISGTTENYWTEMMAELKRKRR